MSKNSQKQLYTQFMDWVQPRLKDIKKRRKQQQANNEQYEIASKAIGK